MEPLEESIVARRAEAKLFGDEVVLGRYHLAEELGRGGWSVVHAAHDPILDREVAIKLLRAAREDERDSIARVVREARILARFHHPNIVQIHEAWEEEGRLCIVMQRVRGETLRAWLAREPRTWRAVSRVALGAASGLAEAHRHGVVHRDVKPENILVDAGGEARVVDFGLATITAAQDPASESLHAPESETPASTTIGTPAYAAPEQLSGQIADPRSDEFSLALTFAEAVGYDPVEAREGRLRRNARTPAIPRRLARVLRRGLAAHPEDRYPSLDGFIKALTRTLSHRRWLAGAIVAFVAVGLLIVARVMIRDTPITEPLPALIPVQQLEILATADPTVAAAILVAVQDRRAESWWRRAAHTIILQPRPGPVLEAGAHVKSLRVHPDGTRLLVADDSGNAVLWDLRSSPPGQQHLKRFNDLADIDFSPDGFLLLAADNGGQVMLWNVDDASVAYPVCNAGFIIAEARFAASEARVITYSETGAARVLAFAQGAECTVKSTLTAKDGRGRAVALLPAPHPTLVFDSGAVVREIKGYWTEIHPPGPRDFVATTTCTATGDVYLAHKNGRLVRINGHDPDRVVTTLDGGVQLACSPSGRLLAAARPDHIAILDPLTLAEVRRLPHPGPALGLRFSTDEAWIHGVAEGQAFALAVDGRTGPRVFAGHSDGVRTIETNREGWLFTGSNDATVRAWPPNDRSRESEFLRPPRGIKDPAAVIVAVDSDETRALVSTGACASLWQIAPEVHYIRDVHCSDSKHVWRARWNPGNTLAVTASSDGEVRVIPVDTEGPVVVIAHPAEVRAADFGPEYDMIATACDDGNVRLYYPDGEGEPSLLRGHPRGPMGDVLFAPDGGKVAARSGGTARVWDLDNAEIRVIVHDDLINTIAFSADSQRLLTASDDGSLRLSNIRTGAQSDVMRKPQMAIHGGTFCDPDLIAAGSSDGLATLLLGGAARIELRGHTSGVRRIACRAGLVATASYDGWVAVWNMREPGEPLLRIPYGYNAYDVRFLKDGRLITMSGEPAVRIVPITTDPQELGAKLRQWLGACPPATLLARRTTVPLADAEATHASCEANLRGE